MFGFLWFDEKVLEDKTSITQHHFSGIGCVAGQQVFKFNKLDDIPPHILWWSNLDKSHTWRIGSLTIKDRYFLGVDALVIKQNFSLAKTTKNQLVAFLAQIFKDTLYLVERFYKEKGVTYELGKGSLVECLHELLAKSFNANTEEQYRDMFKLAYVEKISLQKESKLNKEKFGLLTFQFEPVYYFTYILSQSLPLGNWKIETENLSLDWLKKQHKALVQIDNIQFNDTLHVNPAKIWLGDRGSLLNGTVIDYIWLTEKEVLFLSQHATFDMKFAITTGKSAPFLNYVRDKLVNVDLLQSFSTSFLAKTLSYQLFHQIIILAFMSVGYDKQTRKKWLMNENMIWGRAEDRFLCFEFMQALLEHHFIPVSYGNGEVTVQIPKGQTNYKSLIETLKAHHVIVPDDLLLLLKMEDVDTDLQIRLHHLNSSSPYNHHLFINGLGLLHQQQEISTLSKMLISLNFTQSDEHNPVFKQYLSEISNILRTQHAQANS